MENSKVESKHELHISQTINPSVYRHNSISSMSAEEVKLDYTSRKKIREEVLDQIEEKLEAQAQSTRVRVKQNLFIYFLNLGCLVGLSILNAFILIDVGKNDEQKIIVINSIVIIGSVSSVISNLMVAPWLQVLKLYFIPDSITPIIISTFIATYEAISFLNTGQWYFKTVYPFLVIELIYISGYLRVIIAYCHWERWQVIFFKLVVMGTGLAFFYVGFVYLRGGYKITKGFFLSLEIKLKDLMTLYVFGAVELFFEFYRKLSQFDQTDNLKYEYFFADASEAANKTRTEISMKNLKQEILQEEINDLISSQFSHHDVVSESSKKSKVQAS